MLKLYTEGGTVLGMQTSLLPLAVTALVHLLKPAELAGAVPAMRAPQLVQKVVGKAVLVPACLG